jgi:hypothetical protein
LKKSLSDEIKGQLGFIFEIYRYLIYVAQAITFASDGDEEEQEEESNIKRKFLYHLFQIGCNEICRVST